MLMIQGDTNTNSQLLVDVDWVSENYANTESIRVIDMRDSDDYLQSYLPNAVNVLVDDIASTVNDIVMEFDEDNVQTVLNNIGITPHMAVVIYDNLG